MVEVHQGEASAALGYLEEARALTNELDDRRRGMFLKSLAYGYCEAGDLEAAIRVGLQGLALLRSAQAHLDAGYLEPPPAYLAPATRVGRARSLARLVPGPRRGDDRLGSPPTRMPWSRSGRARRRLRSTSRRGDCPAEGAETIRACSTHLRRGARPSASAATTRPRRHSSSRRAARDHAPASRRREILSWADVLATRATTSLRTGAGSLAAR
jgi:hypothetical protein